MFKALLNLALFFTRPTGRTLRLLSCPRRLIRPCPLPATLKPAIARDGVRQSAIAIIAVARGFDTTRAGLLRAPSLQKHSSWHRDGSNRGRAIGARKAGMIHSPSVHTGIAWPMTADAGTGPKYRPSKESADCQFMTKISSAERTRHPCETGSRLPRLSRSRARPISISSIVIVRPVLQTVCPGSARIRLSMGTPTGK
jgi:hypothetical protein